MYSTECKSFAQKINAAHTSVGYIIRIYLYGGLNNLASLFNKRRVRLVIISESVYLELKMLKCNPVKYNNF